MTSVSGRQFVDGLLLVTTVVGVPLVSVIVSLGLAGSIGVGQIILITLVGTTVCTVAIAIAVGLGVN